MRIFQGLLIASITIVCIAANGARAEDAAAAVYQPCIACHGDTGQGNVELGAPAVAGQDAAYLARQLNHFKSGVRGSDARDTLGAQMKAMAAHLSNEDISLLANYLVGLPKRVPVNMQEGDLKNGNNYYQSKCGACHGGQAEGNPSLNAPGLAWLDAAYLKQQYQNFQQGLRGAHPEDIYGRQMQMMSTSLPSDKDLDDVIAYIQAQGAAR